MASHDSVSLTWDDPADATITHYQVFRRDTSIHAIGEFITLKESTGSSDTTYTDETVEPENKYVYRVKAVNAQGASPWSSFAKALTPAAPGPPPTADDQAPTGLTAALAEGGGVTLSWTAPAEGADSVSGYEILRAVGEGELATLVADTGSTATTYSDATATEAGETYAYQVKAIRGEERSQASGQAQVQHPHDPVHLAPTGLTATLAEGGGATLTWTAPVEDADSVSGYEILRAVGEGELTTLVSDTGNTATAYTDVTATEAGETYAYQVKAIRGEDRSRASGQVQVQIPHDAVDLAPSGLTATLAEGGGTSLTWTAPAENADSVSGYEILRTVGEGELATLVSDTGNTATTYTDATATATDAEETYAYQVKAIRAGVRSQASAEASVARPTATVATCEFDARGSDLPADTSTACALEVGGSVRGERGAADDVDWYRVGLQARATYQFDMRGKWTGEWQLVDGVPAFVSVGSLEDPKLLGIYDATGALVAGSDSEVAGTGKDSRIASFSPGADGVYFISASAESAWTGTYELSLTVTAGEHIKDLSLLAPGGLTVTLVDGGGASLTWSAPAKDADSVSGYEILRAVGEGALTTLVADTRSTATAYSDATARQAGTTYAYGVIALRDGVKSQQSGEASVELPEAEGVRGGVQVACPATDTKCSGTGPTDLTVAETAAGLQLSWKAPAAPTLDGAETTVLQYEIRRSPGSDTYALVACVDAAARSYLDATAEAGGQYRYQVRAIYFVNEACAALRDIDVDLTVGGVEYKPVDGLWSDGTTLWASDEGEDRILAFRLSDGLYDSTRDIIAEDGSNPRGLWARDGRLWVLTESGSGSTPVTLDGFSLTDDSTFGSRTARVTLGPTSGQNDAPQLGYGLWADEDTFWIAVLGNRIQFAYDWAESGTLNRNTAKEGFPRIGTALNNTLVVSMWGDGTTMWIATQLSSAHKKVAANNWPDRTRDNSRYITLRTSHKSVGGMWSDGEIIWIASGTDDLYAYPLSNDRQHSAWARSNRPPVVTVTPASAVVAGAGTLSPSVKVTDPENDTLSYAWTSNGGGAFDDAAIAGATWTAPAATASAQSITLTLTVTDAHSETATATVVVTVPASTSGSPTVSVTGAPAIVDGGEAVTLAGTAADPESDGLTYAWSSDGGGTFADATALDTTWTAPAATLAAQSSTLTLTVTDDSSGANSAASAVVVIVRANRAPEVELSPAAAILSGVAPEVSLEATVTDHEDDSLTHAWSSDGGGTFANAAAASTTWTAPAATTADQEITLTLAVADAAGNTVSAAVAITLRANRPPAVTVTPSEDSVAGGRTLTLDATAVDPEGDGLTYAWSSDLGGTFADAAAPDTSWTAPDAISDEDATLTLTVTDAVGNSSSVMVVITVLANVPPIGALNVMCAADDDACSGPGPTNVALSEVESGLQLSWEPAPKPTGEEAETEVHQYQILRAVGGTDFKLLACEPPESRSYLDAETEADRHYRYLVRAIYFPNDACAALRDIDMAVTIAGAGAGPVDGLWSDGTTLWASDNDGDRILAFKLADGARDSGQDIIGEDRSSPTGLWGRDGRLWAATSTGPFATPASLDGFSLAADATFGTRTARVMLGSTAGESDAPPVGGNGLWGDEDTFWISVQGQSSCSPMTGRPAAR